jgi:hypothetical protein
MPVTDIPEFLDKMVGILERLRVTSRDALRHERDMAEREELRTATSSTHSWRACDRRAGEDDQIAA